MRRRGRSAAWAPTLLAHLGRKALPVADRVLELDHAAAGRLQLLTGLRELAPGAVHVPLDQRLGAHPVVAHGLAALGRDHRRPGDGVTVGADGAVAHRLVSSGFRARPATGHRPRTRRVAKTGPSGGLPGPLGDVRSTTPVRG